MKENPVRSMSGLPFLLGVLVVAILAVWIFIKGTGAPGGAPNPPMLIAAALIGLVAFFSLIGLYTVQPNQAAVLSLFGKYIGTVKDNGL
ncbi:MAG: SPFH domain-containing protein, partial [Pseudoxanthomonas sp.]